jgi:hypothetical protein
MTIALGKTQSARGLPKVRFSSGAIPATSASQAILMPSAAHGDPYSGRGSPPFHFDRLQNGPEENPRPILAIWNFETNN